MGAWDRIFFSSWGSRVNQFFFISKYKFCTLQWIIVIQQRAVKQIKKSFAFRLKKDIFLNVAALYNYSVIQTNA